MVQLKNIVIVTCILILTLSLIGCQTQNDQISESNQVTIILEDQEVPDHEIINGPDDNLRIIENAMQYLD